MEENGAKPKSYDVETLMLRDKSFMEFHDDKTFGEKAFTVDSLAWQPGPLVRPPTKNVSDPGMNRYLKDSDWVVGLHFRGVNICVPSLVLRLTHAITLQIDEETSAVLSHIEVCSYAAAYITEREFLGGEI